MQRGSDVSSQFSWLAVPGVEFLLDNLGLGEGRRTQSFWPCLPGIGLREEACGDENHYHLDPLRVKPEPHTGNWGEKELLPFGVRMSKLELL